MTSILALIRGTVYTAIAVLLTAWLTGWHAGWIASAIGALVLVFCGWLIPALVFWSDGAITEDADVKVLRAGAIVAPVVVVPLSFWLEWVGASRTVIGGYVLMSCGFILGVVLVLESMFRRRARSRRKPVIL